MLSHQQLDELIAIFKDVDYFLVTSLKNERLKTETSEKRDVLVTRIHLVLDSLNHSMGYDDAIKSELLRKGEEPNRHTGSSQQTSLHDANNEADKEDDYSNAGNTLRCMSVADLNACLRQGNLEKKTRKIGGFSSWQMRYIVVKDNKMYTFKTRSDQRQTSEIDLFEYQTRAAIDIDRRHKRDDSAFEISRPGHRTYQFIAQSPEDMECWMHAVKIASVIQATTSKSVKDIDESLPATSQHAVEDDIYDVAMTVNDFNESMPSTPQPVEDDIYDVAISVDVNEMMVLDTQQFQPITNEDSQPHGEIVLKFEENMEENRKPVNEEDLYDEIKIKTCKEVTAAHKPVNNDNISYEERAQHHGADLTAEEVWKDDFDNVYMGLWDCLAEEENELEFRRGDLIHILKREYDEWWIAEKNYQVGLVPRMYIQKAYLN